MQTHPPTDTANARPPGEVGLDVPLAAIEAVDPGVIAKLPSGTQVLSIRPHGSSFWTRTARLDVELPTGSQTSYFLKATRGDLGRDMVLSEHTSMSMIHTLQPHLVPRPLAWGSYVDIPGIQFLLCEFLPMENELPDEPDVLATAVAEFHKASAATFAHEKSPSREKGKKYGFDMTTYHGNVPIQHGWSDTWEEYFTRTTRRLLGVELEARGSWSTRDTVPLPLASGEQQDTVAGTDAEQVTASPKDSMIVDAFFSKVVPRLLRHLEPNIEPVLIHGDLWHGNVGVASATGNLVIFDAAGFWAHNEYELAVWRQPWNNIGHNHRMCYHEHFPPSEPVDECEDRNLLYSVRVNILDSILYREDIAYRTAYVTAMHNLVDKYAR